MFEKEFFAFSTATPEALWAHYADVSRWKGWDEAVERCTLEGPFTKGSSGTLQLHGKPALAFTLTEVTPNVSFSDETKVGPMTVRFTHTLTKMTGGTKITHHVAIEGKGANELGAAMTVQHSVDALARLGNKGTTPTLGGVIPSTSYSVAKALALSALSPLAQKRARLRRTYQFERLSTKPEISRAAG